MHDMENEKLAPACCGAAEEDASAAPADAAADTAAETPRKRHRTPEEYQDLINRLNRIEGQIRGVRGMVERDVYCPEILFQATAVGKAINSFSKELLAQHIRTCVVDDLEAGHYECVDELVSVLQKLMK